MSQNQAMVIGLIVGGLAAALQAWWLLRMIGFGFWYLVFVVPLALMTMQVVGGTVAKFLMGPRRPS